MYRTNTPRPGDTAAQLEARRRQAERNLGPGEQLYRPGEHPSTKSDKPAPVAVEAAHVGPGVWVEFSDGSKKLYWPA
jgi:hypothetical protein